MMADNLERADVECAILKGRIDRRFTDDPRGTRYRILGPACDQSPVCVVCRLNESGELLVITVYTAEVSQ